MKSLHVLWILYFCDKQKYIFEFWTIKILHMFTMSLILDVIQNSKTMMKDLWSLRNCVEICHARKNTFTFQFAFSRDMDFVLRSRPWFFGRYMIALNTYDARGTDTCSVDKSEDELARRKELGVE